MAATNHEDNGQFEPGPLRTAFIGNDNVFTRCLCEWLSEHTDLSIILFSNKLSWRTKHKYLRSVNHVYHRRKRWGTIRALEEIAYYGVYRAFLIRSEEKLIKTALDTVPRRPRKPLTAIPQVMLQPGTLNSPELLRRLEALNLDAAFSMCIDAYLPEELTELPRHGTFLWHEGYTPEYRGKYAAFWALVNEDYGRLGYTLLRVNNRLDSGEIYVQGPVRDIDVRREWHAGYIGHKAVLDSLPEVKTFLSNLARGTHRPISRPGAEDRIYSYPTVTALAKIVFHRLTRGDRI